MAGKAIKAKQKVNIQFAMGRKVTQTFGRSFFGERVVSGAAHVELFGIIFSPREIVKAVKLLNQL